MMWWRPGGSSTSCRRFSVEGLNNSNYSRDREICRRHAALSGHPWWRKHFGFLVFVFPFATFFEMINSPPVDGKNNNNINNNIEKVFNG